MSEYDSLKKAKRDYWDEQINSLSAEIDSDDWSEEESIGLYLDIASKMAEEGVYRPRKYDSSHLLEALLITRNELNRLISFATFDSDEEKQIAWDAHDKCTGELLAFLVEVHRIVSVQKRSPYGGEDKDVRQELYNLFEHKNSYSAEVRAEEKMKMMIRLIMLSVPDSDWRQRKNWAYRNFVKREVWPESKKSKRWKELKKFWEDNGDVWAEGDFDSIDEEINAFWELLLERQRAEPVPRGTGKK